MPNDDPTGDLSPTERNVAELNARVLILESENDALKEELAEYKVQLKAANDLIDGDTKARLVQQAVGITTIPLVELAGKDIGELEAIITVTNLAKKPRFESGASVLPTAGRDEKFDPRTHLHSLYVGNRKD